MHARSRRSCASPTIAGSSRSSACLLAFAQGRFGEVEALAQQALEMGQEAQNQNAALVFGVQIVRSAPGARAAGGAGDRYSRVWRRLYPSHRAASSALRRASAAAELGPRSGGPRGVRAPRGAGCLRDLAANSWLALQPRLPGRGRRAPSATPRARGRSTSCCCRSPASNVTVGPVVPRRLRLATSGSSPTTFGGSETPPRGTSRTRSR